MERKFTEFRESDKSLKHELGWIYISSLLPVSSWHCSDISVLYTRDSRFKYSNPFDLTFFVIKVVAFSENIEGKHSPPAWTQEAYYKCSLCWSVLVGGGGTFPGCGYLPWWGYLPWPGLPPRCGQTDASEKSTFHYPSDAGDKNEIAPQNETARAVKLFQTAACTNWDEEQSCGCKPTNRLTISQYPVALPNYLLMTIALHKVWNIELLRVLINRSRYTMAPVISLD